MTVLDWVFTGIVVILAIRCFVRGFVQEVLSVAAYAVGLIAGLLFANRLAEFGAAKLGLASMHPTVQYVLAFIACFILGFLVMKLVEKLIREGLEAAHLDIFDRVLGLALGVAEGLAVVAFALVLLKIQPFFDVSGLLSGSVFAKTILPFIEPAIAETIKPATGGLIPQVRLPDILKKKK